MKNRWLTDVLFVLLVLLTFDLRLCSVFARDSRNGVQNQAASPLNVYVDDKNDHAPVIANCEQPREIEILEEQEEPLMERFTAHDQDKSVNGLIHFSLMSRQPAGLWPFKSFHAFSAVSTPAHL